MPLGSGIRRNDDEKQGSGHCDKAEGADAPGEGLAGSPASSAGLPMACGRSGAVVAGVDGLAGLDGLAIGGKSLAGGGDEVGNGLVADA